MVQTIFLDTNIILDFIEKRNQEVGKIMEQLLLSHSQEKIALATSVFNLAELIDKEFEIHYIKHFISEGFSFAEIWEKKNNRKEYREISVDNKQKVQKKVHDFLVSNQIQLLLIPFKKEDEELENSEIYQLIYEYQFRSQDALIVATALINKVTYFLSNDANIVNEINNHGLIDAYSLRDPKQRKDFKNNILDSLAEVLE